MASTCRESALPANFSDSVEHRAGRREDSGIRASGWTLLRRRPPLRQARPEQLSGFPVRRCDPCRVHAQRSRSPTAVAEATCDRAEIDTRREQLSCRVVAEGARRTGRPGAGGGGPQPPRSPSWHVTPSPRACARNSLRSPRPARAVRRGLNGSAQPDHRTATCRLHSGGRCAIV
jgi:hypothetical protein